MKKICFALIACLSLALTACPLINISTGTPEFWVYYHFTVENKTSSDISVSLKGAYIPYYLERPYWIIDNLYLDEPIVHAEIKSKAVSELNAWISAMAHFDMGLSFILSIGDKNYAGYAEDMGYSPIDIKEYELGYIFVKLDEIGGENGTGHFISKLTPVIKEKINNSRTKAFYRVIITDEGVQFILEKLRTCLASSI